ncbi:8330_t:CDS:2, partial [Funneliformis mosseae]
AFPDPTEDVFWQKVSTVINESDSNNIDAVWNPYKKELNQRQKDDNIVIAPPPSHPVASNYARHSRKSSRVSWELQTDSERHVDLLETKLNELKSNHKRTHTRSSTVDFDGTPLTTLGYYSEEEIGVGTVFEDEEETDLHPNNHNPQESDEGLWLLWKNQSTNDLQNEVNDDTSTRSGQLWYLPLPILSRSINTSNNVIHDNDLLRRPRMRNENYVTNYREDSSEFLFYDDDDDDEINLNEEMLLNRAKRKREIEYLKFNLRSYECCGCNTTNGLCADLWNSWCCNLVCIPTILFIRGNCCCGICGLEDD